MYWRESRVCPRFPISTPISSAFTSMESSFSTASNSTFTTASSFIALNTSVRNLTASAFAFSCLSTDTGSFFSISSHFFLGFLWISATGFSSVLFSTTLVFTEAGLTSLTTFFSGTGAGLTSLSLTLIFASCLPIKPKNPELSFTSTSTSILLLVVPSLTRPSFIASSTVFAEISIH